MLNDVNIMGRFVRDPEINFTKSGTPVVSFTLAVDRDAKNEDGTRTCDFLDCVAWKGTAEFICKNFYKGKPVLISGRMQSRTFEDKNGVYKKSVEVLVQNVYFADYSKKEEFPL